MDAAADCLSPAAQQQAEARLAAKRAARAEAREIRMKELERQQKEKYYGLDTKWGDIEQWMEDSERYSRRARRNASASDEDERMSVGSRGSLRSHLDYASTYPVAGLESERTKKKNYSKATNGYEEDVYGSSQSRKSSRASVYEESVYSGSRRYSAPSSRAPSEYSCYLGSGSRASSRASSARASPVIEERPEKDFEKGARTVSSLSAATLASLGGTSSRRGSGDTSISADTEASIREIKDIYELKDQIQDVEGKYMQGLKELKDSLAEVEEKYKKAMVSNAQLDNEKTNFMYQVDTLKDALLELEEQLAESRRQYEEKSKEFEREKHAHSILQFQFMEIKEALKQREEMLAEIQQLQQKQQSYVREISDLQETIEWKDKKIGALERQKDFFDSIRSERDDLRDEVVVLKEQLKKHGIIPDSDVATNGDTSDILDNEGHLDSSRTAPGTTQALKTGGEGMLGKANEVEMKNEILEDVGKREILQNTEHEEHKEESEEEEVQTLHAAENAKAEQMVEERDALPAVMLPESRFAEQAQSLTEPVSESTSSNRDSDSDTEGLRKGTESRGTAAQQPERTEAEHHDLSARTNENLELGSLQGHPVFESPQEMFCDSGTEQELGEAAPNQEEQEDLETSHALSDDEMDEGSDRTSESSELVSNQAGPPEGAVAGLPREEGNVESSTPEEPQHSEESAENKVANVLEEKFVDCTDGRSDKTAGDRAEGEDEVGNTVQGQPRETESVGLEGTEPRERDVPAEPLGEEGGEHQALIQPASSEDSASASPEEPGTQGKTEDDTAPGEKDGQKEGLGEELEKCSGSAETGEQGVASVEVGGSIPEGKGSELQQAQPGTEVITQESHLDPSLLDDEIKESELETGDEAGEGQESRREWVEDLNPKAEVQTSQGGEETAGGTEGEKNVPLEGAEVQKVVKQVEVESTEESGVGVSVTTENKASKETLKANEQEVELADHPGGEFASEEGANNALEHKLVRDENIGEQDKLEEGANNSLEQKAVQDENIGEQDKLEEGANNSLAHKLVQDENIGEQVKLEEGVNPSLPQKAVQDEKISEQVKLEEGANNSLEQKPVQDENIDEQVKLEEGVNASLPQKAVQDDIGEEVKLEVGVNNSLAQKPVLDENTSEQIKLEEGANNSLPQKPVQDDISEEVKLEDQAEESLEDDGDAFDFDEESNQILESDEKCDGVKTDAQGEEDDGANGAVGKTAHTDKAGEGPDKMESKDALTKGEVLQDKKDEPEETGCLEGKALGKADEAEADVEEDEIKVSDSSKVGKFQDRDVLEQDLENAFIKKAESREDLQVGKRSKGRSRDDCTIS